MDPNPIVSEVNNNLYIKGLFTGGDYTPDGKILHAICTQVYTKKTGPLRNVEYHWIQFLCTQIVSEVTNYSKIYSLGATVPVK